MPNQDWQHELVQIVTSMPVAPHFVAPDVAVAQLWDEFKAPFVSAAEAIDPKPVADGLPPPPANPAKTFAAVTSAAISLIGMGAKLTNMGIAFVTSAIPSLALPAATLGTMYLGPPHGHLHPPSLVPPATVPAPMPSFGPITLGTSCKVLIAGFPAARCGDIAMAVTCGSIAPGAKVQTGSSKVFIVGKRAARVGDATTACVKSGPLDVFETAMWGARQAAAFAGIVAAEEAGEVAAASSDPFLAGAQMLAADTALKQLAMDAVAMAVNASIGSDPATPPAPGRLAAAPHARVLIGGIPLPSYKDPAHGLFKKAKNRWSNRKQKPQKVDGDSAAGSRSCPA
jgi:uncharacterized Zn-binding protein involved in type VI secretion